MRNLSLKLSILALVLVAALAMAPMASASTVTLTQGAYTATLTVGTTTATVTISGPSTGFYVNNVGIQLGGNSVTSTGTGLASSGSWTFMNGLNAVQCGGKTGNWLCAVPSGSNQAGNGLSVTFNFTGLPSGSTASVQFVICSSATPNPCTNGKNGNFITNFSQSGTLTGGGPPPVPEPGTLGLLGTGLVGIAGLLRRRFMA